MRGQLPAKAEPRYGSGLGAVVRDQDPKTEGQDPNGPARSLKVFLFGHQLIIQTSGFEKEDV